MGKNSEIGIRYKCMGASRQVTGSCHLLEIKIKDKICNIVIDYGMVQDNLKKMNELYRTNKKQKSIDWESVDCIILTHSHADHCALLPVAVMQGFKGRIITTEPTMYLTELILTDSAFIQARETERYNKTRQGKKNPLYPIYGQRHVEHTLSMFCGYSYDTEIKLTENITLQLLSAGHLLGASSPYITIQGEEDIKRILFTGDTSGNKKIPFVKTPSYKGLKVDYLFSEGTYGDKLQQRNNVKQKLKTNIRNTILKDKGKLVIPVFSVGRSSSVIKYLYEILNETDEFDDVDIYLASPMACKAHKIYGDENSFEFYDKINENYKDIFNWNKIQYIDDYQVLEKECLNKKSQIILVSSGMICGGYSNAVVAGMLPHDNSSILFCGYQGLGSIGRHILDSEYGEVIKIDGKTIKRKCKIDFMSMSGHADYDKLVDLVKSTRHTKLKEIYLNHGDSKALEHLKNKLNVIARNVIISDYDKWYRLN